MYAESPWTDAHGGSAFKFTFLAQLKPNEALSPDLSSDDPDPDPALPCLPADDAGYSDLTGAESLSELSELSERSELSELSESHRFGIVAPGIMDATQAFTEAEAFTEARAFTEAKAPSTEAVATEEAIKASKAAEGAQADCGSGGGDGGGQGVGESGRADARGGNHGGNHGGEGGGVVGGEGGGGEGGGGEGGGGEGGLVHGGSGVPRQRRVLVADDAVINRRLLRRAFEKYFDPPWHVSEATIAPEALTMLKTAAMCGQPFDLFIADENYEPADVTKGTEAILELRAYEAVHGLPRMPVILCSGNIDVAQDCSDGSIDLCWTKPFPKFADGTMQAAVMAVFDGV